MSFWRDLSVSPCLVSATLKVLRENWTEEVIIRSEFKSKSFFLK